MMATNQLAPIRATIFAYQVGFGDCFLLRFGYSDGAAKHVLIDFGTTGLPKDVESSRMSEIALDIRAKCSGKLEAVVATHRHADHISGFARNAKGNASGDIIRSLRPDVVLQPWTEDPRAARDALVPTKVVHQSLRSHMRALTEMHKVSEAVVAELADKKQLSPTETRIKFIGEDNIKNKSAVENLATMGKDSVYSYHGGPSHLAKCLPGVKTLVLGPPTLKQTERIRKQRSSDPAEFWQIRLAQFDRSNALNREAEELFPGHPSTSGGKLQMSARWFASRLKEARSDQILQIVRTLDAQMNNTSLILLFEVNGKKLLFPGDAQIENWQYALEKDADVGLLRDVDLYKVGHHGSRNATPMSMWSGFAKRGGKQKRGRLKTVMSTLPGKHGHEESSTEVPRRSLLKALQTQSELHSTHLLDSKKLYDEIEISL